MFEPYNLVTPPETNLPESQLPILQYSLPKLQYDLPSLNFPETLFEESQNNQTSTKPIVEQKFNNHKSFVLNRTIYPYEIRIGCRMGQRIEPLLHQILIKALTKELSFSLHHSL